MIGHKKDYMPGTKHFPRMDFAVKRGLRELVNEKTLSKDDWKIVLSFFKNRCAFCGVGHSGDNRTGLIPDHLIPAVEYGELCLGNTVPACHHCNDERGKKNWQKYILNNKPRDYKNRIILIKKYLKAYPYTVQLPSMTLTKSEYSIYRSIFRKWNSLLQEALKLRERIQVRRRKR
jgi:hypothetical protein